MHSLARVAERSLVNVRQEAALAFIQLHCQYMLDVDGYLRVKISHDTLQEPTPAAVKQEHGTVLCSTVLYIGHGSFWQEPTPAAGDYMLSAVLCRV